MIRPEAVLVDVIHSAGTVFEGMEVSRSDVLHYLNTERAPLATSPADLALLADLAAAARYVAARPASPVDAVFVCAINAQITRTGALRPGHLRAADQRIGVSTRRGRHEPPALTERGFRSLIDGLAGASDLPPIDAAIDLFVGIAAAQPFEDANKRTALLAANGHLRHHRADLLLVAPGAGSEEAALADAFNDQLAVAYIHRDPSGVKELLMRHGVVTAPPD